MLEPSATGKPAGLKVDMKGGRNPGLAYKERGKAAFMFDDSLYLFLDRGRVGSPPLLNESQSQVHWNLYAVSFLISPFLKMVGLRGSPNVFVLHIWGRGV